MLSGLMMGWLLLAQEIGFAPVAADEVVIEHKNATGFIRGRHLFPAENFESGEQGRTRFGVRVTTQTIRHQVVKGDQTGGRVDLEPGNIFQGGSGDDLVVTYGRFLANDEGQAFMPGVFLMGERGDDILLGASGADYLVSGSGYDRLYGERGSDTYIIIAQPGATTIIADRVSPLAPSLEVKAANDQNTIRLPAGVTPEQLRLSQGTAWVESVTRHNHALPLQRMQYSTVDLTWGTAQKVSIVLTDATDLNSSGIEIIEFVDGASIGLDQIIAASQLKPLRNPARPR